FGFYAGCLIKSFPSILIKRFVGFHTKFHLQPGRNIQRAFACGVQYAYSKFTDQQEMHR
ncbi:hypothetical protein MKW98_012129, partial [Papaver atlanticum]